MAPPSEGSPAPAQPFEGLWLDIVEGSWAVLSVNDDGTRAELQVASQPYVTNDRIAIQAARAGGKPVIRYQLTRGRWSDKETSTVSLGAGTTPPIPIADDDGQPWGSLESRNERLVVKDRRGQIRVEITAHQPAAPAEALPLNLDGEPVFQLRALDARGRAQRLQATLAPPAAGHGSGEGWPIMGYAAELTAETWGWASFDRTLTTLAISSAPAEALGEQDLRVRLTAIEPAGQPALRCEAFPGSGAGQELVLGLQTGDPHTALPLDDAAGRRWGTLELASRALLVKDTGGRVRVEVAVRPRDPTGFVLLVGNREVFAVAIRDRSGHQVPVRRPP